MRYLTRARLWLTTAIRHFRPFTPVPSPAQAPPPGLRPELAEAIARRRRALGIPAPGHPPLPGRHRHGMPQKVEQHAYPERPVHPSPAERRVRSDQSRHGMIRLPALAHQANARAGARAEAGAVAS